MQEVHPPPLLYYRLEAEPFLYDFASDAKNCFSEKNNCVYCQVYLLYFVWECLFTIATFAWYLPFNALIWIFSTVYPQIQFFFKFMWEIFITLTVFIWFLSNVCHHMIYKSSITWGSFVTIATLIWFNLFITSLCP